MKSNADKTCVDDMSAAEAACHAIGYVKVTAMPDIDEAIASLAKQGIIKTSRAQSALVACSR